MKDSWLCQIIKLCRIEWRTPTENFIELSQLYTKLSELYHKLVIGKIEKTVLSKRLNYLDITVFLAYISMMLLNITI